MTNTRDKLNEAKHFLEEMKRFSPQTDAFRYTFTAFLSALRSITPVMQKEFSRASGFSEWYTTKQTAMENHSVLKYLHRQRNLTHHERPVLIYPIGVAERVTENNRIRYTLTGTGDTLNLNPVFSVPCPQYAPKVISVEKERQRMGQAAYRQRPAAGSPKAKTVKAVYQSSQGLKFKKIKVSEGGKGPRVYEFARLKAIEVRKGLPSKTKWLLVRRNLDGSEVKFFISNAPQEVCLKEMAKVASSRWPVEISFEEAKQEVGLDEYEVRSWRGRHHHITMSMLALAFLTFARKRLGEKNDRDDRSGSKAHLAMAFA